MPANDYYDSTGAPSAHSLGASAPIANEFDLIEDGFNKMPTLSGGALKLVRVNVSETSLESVDSSTILADAELLANKDATGGYVGLTLFKINFKNVLNTITSFFTNSNTVARTYTFPNKDGTVAMTSDITGTNTGMNTGDQTATTLPFTPGGTISSTNTRSAVLELDTDLSSLSSLVSGLPKVDSLNNIGNAGTSKTLDTVTYDTFVFTCDQATLDLSSTSISTGRTVTLIITGGSTCTITWPTGMNWPGGSEPSLSAGTDRIVMQKVTSLIIHGSLAGAQYA